MAVVLDPRRAILPETVGGDPSAICGSCRGWSAGPGGIARRVTGAGLDAVAGGGASFGTSQGRRTARVGERAAGERRGDLALAHVRRTFALAASEKNLT